MIHYLYLTGWKKHHDKSEVLIVGQFANSNPDGSLPVVLEGLSFSPCPVFINRQSSPRSGAVNHVGSLLSPGTCTGPKHTWSQYLNRRDANWNSVMKRDFTLYNYAAMDFLFFDQKRLKCRTGLNFSERKWKDVCRKMRNFTQELALR